MIDEKGTSLPDCPSLLKALLAFTAAATNGPYHSLNVLVQLSASMRAQGHGGSLLVVPTGSESWREVTDGVGAVQAASADSKRTDTAA